MKRGTTIAVVFLIDSLAVHGATDYSLSPVANSTAGHRGSSADYTLDSTATPGGIGESADYAMRSGFAGQLAAVSGIAIQAPSPTLNEGSTLQLTAEWLFDDGSRAALDPGSLAWSVQSGPVSVSAGGLATAAAVYQNEAATLRADKETFHETLALTVINSLPDNYGSYASDALPDSWQVQYFGINAALAGRFDDFDNDDVSNLLEYANGTHPASPGSGVAPLSYQGNSIVPGNPTIEYLPTPGALPHRAVFIRRKNVPGVNYVPQFSRNLVSWAGATTPLVVLADDGVFQVVSHRFPVTIGGLRSSSKFFRLHVNATPEPAATPMRFLFLAVLLKLAATQTGMGAIYYSGIRNIGIPTNDIGVAIRLSDELVSYSIVPDLDAGSWINFYFSGSGIASSTYLRPAITAPPSGNGDGLVVRKVAMQDIGAADNFASGANGSENHLGSGAGQFQEGSPGFIGFAMRSTLNGPVSYGWMRVTLNGTNPGIIHDWAYETTNGMSILAGAVPEPASVSLLAGAALACCLRRQRRASSKSNH